MYRNPVVGRIIRNTGICERLRRLVALLLKDHVGIARFPHGRCGIGGPGDGRDEAIPLAIARLDEALRLPGVADGMAYGLQTIFNGGIPGAPSRPHLGTEFLLRNHTVAVRQKIEERLEHFGSQAHRLASPVQEITLGVEEAIRKDVTHGLDLSALEGAHTSEDRTDST
jgi:hypothetical protein